MHGRLVLACLKISNCFLPCSISDTEKTAAANLLSPSTSVEWWPVGCLSYHYVTQRMWALHVRHVTTHQRHASSISGWFNDEEWYQLTSRIQILYFDGYFDYYATARTLILSLGCLWSGLGFLPFSAAKSTTTTTSTFIGIAMSRWHCRIKYWKKKREIAFLIVNNINKILENSTLCVGLTACSRFTAEFRQQLLMIYCLAWFRPGSAEERKSHISKSRVTCQSPMLICLLCHLKLEWKLQSHLASLQPW